MRVILTKKEEFASKKGQEYVKLSYVGLDGYAGQVFLTKEKYLTEKVDDNLIVNQKTMSEIEKICDVVDVEFDQAGRLVGIRS